MIEDIENKNDDNSYEYKLREVSNEQIISILQYRNHFQPLAVEAAINEALKRNIISSVNDLNKKAFQPQPVRFRSLFPIGTSNAHTFAIFKSLCRIFYGFGLLPAIFSLVQFTNHKIYSGLIALVFASSVFYIVNRLEKTLKPIYSTLIMGLNIPAIAYAFYYLASKGIPSIMDAFAISIVIIVLLYTTSYLNKLTIYFNKGNNKEL